MIKSTNNTITTIMNNKCINHLKNGVGNNVNFKKIPVYYYHSNGEFEETKLKNKLDKTKWVLDNIIDKNKLNEVLSMLKNWDLYEKGWLFTSYDDVKLFYYLGQIGNTIKPKELDYFN